jgi:hypothetical protein
MRALLSLLLIVAAVIPARAELPTADELLASSISHHDPQDVWSNGRIHLEMEVVYSEKLAEQRGIEKMTTSLWLAPGHGEFRCIRAHDGGTVEYRIEAGEGATFVNGRSEFSDEDRERLRVGDPLMYRDYFEYMWGMPMKLRDPGTNIDPVVRETTFQDQPVLALRVTYDPEVGTDVWDFFFDPDSSTLIGCRFFHDEAANDGEYIVFTAEVHDESSGLRMPGGQAWYYNDGRGHLATDSVTKFEVTR